MDALLELLTTIPDRPIGTLLLVGAGALAPDRLDLACATRIVLVDGDPQVAAELRQSASAFGHVQVIEQVVARAATPVHWRRYNMRALNGPIDAATWSERYPRLQHLQTQVLPACPLDQLIDAALPTDSRPQDASTLLLDLPGQENDVLGDLDAATLQRFDWIGLRQNVGATSGPAHDAILKAQFVNVSPAATDGTSPWTVSLFRFDRHASLARQLAAAQAKVHALDHELRTAKAELDHLTTQAEADRRVNEAEVQRLKSELLATNAARQEAEAALELSRRNAATELAKLRDAQAALAAARKQASDTEAARAKLLEQITDRDERQRQLDAEILKAEAQFELVKSLLFRERHS